MIKKNSLAGFALMIFKFLLREHDYDFAVGDIIESYENIKKKQGSRKATSWIWIQLLSSAKRLILNSLFHGGDMFKNYLKIAIRNLLTHKLFSLINISGFAIGFATFLLISFWIENELSYDRFHRNADRIYRIERELFRDNMYSRWPITGGKYKDALIEDIPEIQNAVRFWGRLYSLRDYENKTHRQSMFATDNSIFEIFDFNLIDGDEKSALVRPKSVVMTTKNAIKFFGTADAVGKSIVVDWNNEPTDFKVTGILEEIPENSHLQFNMLMSISSFPAERFEKWRSNYLYTYVLLREGSDYDKTNQKLSSFIENHLEVHYDDLTSQGLGIHEVLKLDMFPVNDIHLNPCENWELGEPGSISSVYLFSSIALLILIIAGINFMSLSTARANKRAKEVSLRKTVGAGKNYLRLQFLIESVLMALLALIISFVLLILLLPVYNSIFNSELFISQFFNLKYILFSLGIALTGGILAGLYPAFYLSKFEPIEVIKGHYYLSGNKSIFRRNLVIFQFFISFTLIIGMLTVYYQMNYIQNKSLGFDKNNMLLIPIRNNALSGVYETFRNNLLRNNNIEAVAGSSDRPGDTYFGNGSVFNRELSSNAINMNFLNCNVDFIDTYKMELLAGRSFSREFRSDTTGTMVLNEAAVKRIGWKPEEAVGKVLDRGNPQSSLKIVGVVKDFNFQSLKREIEPLAMVLLPDYIFALSIRIKDENIPETISLIEEEWEKHFPNEVFNYGFLDLMLNRMYEGETKMQNILIAFSTLSILIACLGLLGLTSFTTEEKTKEIGIRKTLGASIIDILVLLTKEFVKWIAVGTLIAWPVSFYLITKWLENFVYHIEPGWMIFLSATIISLLIAVFTISFQVLLAAKKNPVESLKYE